MNQRQIEVFLAVMRFRSVTLAAEHLEMSQPSVSKNIALAEHQLGFALFERVRGRLVPTPEASLVHDEAMRIQSDIARFDRFLVNVKQYKVGQLRIGATPALAISMLPIVAKRFRECFPDYGLVLDMHVNHEIKDAVERQQYDLGLLVIPTAAETEDMQVMQRGEMVCVLPDTHPAAHQERVAWQDLNARELIYITTDISLVELLTQGIPGFASRAASAIESNRYTTAVNLVKQGLGVTLVDEFTLIGMEQKGIAVRRFEPTMAVSLVAVVGESRALKRSAMGFLECLVPILTEAAS
jgi:DNA-binding transcriptional LysR family regulator